MSVNQVRILRAENEGLDLAGSLRDLWRGRELLRAWTEREIKVRYKQAALGAVWAVLQPLSMMIVFSVIFTFFVRVPTGDVPYPLFAYVALLPWTFFTTAVSSGSVSIINNMGLVSKIQFPREVLPLASVGAAGFDLIIGSVLLVGLMIWYHVGLSWAMLSLAPLFLLQLAFVCGLGLFLSALTVRFRDIRFVVPLGLQLWLYASPIIYPLSLVPAQWQWVLRLNPMTPILEGYRGALLYGRAPAAEELALVAGAAILMLGLGYLYFKTTEVWFADIL